MTAQLKYSYMFGKVYFFVLIISTLLLGCSSYGPKQGSSEFSTTVSAAVQPSKVIAAQSAQWLPNIFGFNNILNETPIEGTFVLTQNEVVFLVWNTDSSAFIRATSIQRSDINHASVDSMGLGRRLVVVSKDKVNSFTLLSPSQTFVDASGTEKAAKLLNYKK